jgi:hypothetical protein
MQKEFGFREWRKLLSGWKKPEPWKWLTIAVRKLFPGWKKPEPWDWLEIAIFALCVMAPFYIHEGASCHGSGVFHSAIFHSPFLHEIYIGKSSYLQLEFDQYSCWELFGIIQASVVSFFLLFRVKEYTRKILLVAAAIVVLGPLACLALLTGALRFYEICVIAILISFSLEDYNLYRRSRQIEYRMLIRFVDIPILTSVILLTWFVGFPIRDEYRHFYSGAIAFQLIVGTLLLILIRLQSFVRANNSVAPNASLSPDPTSSKITNLEPGSENKHPDARTRSLQ